MKFINRERELQRLATIRQASETRSQMTVLVGRRRIGKTRLVRESLKDRPYLYFFVARKEERLLCEEYVAQVQALWGEEVFGEIRHFRDIFRLLLTRAERESLTLVIDEFQEFSRINSAVYSEMQDLWDRFKDRTRMNLILSGSVYSLMQRIFEHSKEPLFGRADHRLEVKPFGVAIQRQLLTEQAPQWQPDDLLTFYLLTGGVPKYVEQLVDQQKLNQAAMIDVVFQPDSLFLEEGKNVLIEEFGKEYTTYFSILALLAGGRTDRPAMESMLQKDVGGYLEQLEKHYQLIRKVRPILAKPQSRQVRYEIQDNFLQFWFRFIYKHKGAVEIGNFAYLKEVYTRDYPTYSGHLLEKWFRTEVAASGEWAEVGRYWEKGHQNEIDIVAINPLDKRVLCAEVKRNAQQYSEAKLRAKAQGLLRKFGGYEIEYRGFSLGDLRYDEQW